MALKKITKITNKQIAEKGVQALADRPNLTAQYGASGLSAAQLKLWFDKLATFLAERINEISDAISSDEATNYIRVCLDEYGVDNLGALITAFTDGDFAAKVLKVFPSAGSTQKQALQTVINIFAQEFSRVREDLKKMGVQNIEFSRKTEEGDNAYIITYGNGNKDELVAPRGEKGEKGDIGPQGEKGDKGEKGDSGDIAGQNELDKINKDIENIYTLLGGTVTDKEPLSQAYSTRETANGNIDIIDGQYTPVNLIEGATVQSQNLLPYPFTDVPSEKNGVTITDTGDGTLTLNGTATTTFYIDLLKNKELAGGDYTLSGVSGISGLELCFEDTEQYKEAAENITVTHADEVCYISLKVLGGATFSNVTVKPMLNAGSEAKPFSPYGALLHAYFKAIKSTGRNLIPFPYYEGMSKTHNGITFTVNDDGTIIVNGTNDDNDNSVIYLAWDITLPAGTFTLSLTTTGGSADLIFTKNNVYYSTAAGYAKTFTLTEPFECRAYLQIPKGSTASYSNVKFSCMLKYGSTATEYEPYTENFFELPEAKELPAFVSLNPQTGELTNANARVVLTGDETVWTDSLTATSGKFRWALFYNHNNYPLGVKGYGIASGGYDTVTDVDTWYNKKGAHFNGNEFSFYDPDYADSEDAWRNHLRALYQAGTPIIVEIKMAEPILEKLENIPKSYKAYNGGSEAVVQGETDNSEYGAMPTITQDYYTQKGV